MTDEEIVKALECCAIDKDFDCSQCIGCAFETQGICCENATEGIAKAALNIINRQKAEIERLKKLYEMAVAEREANVKGFTEQLKTAKVEAIKEFAERLKKHLCCYDLPDYHYFEAVDEDVIDDLVKEMAGKIDVKV